MAGDWVQMHHRTRDAGFDRTMLMQLIVSLAEVAGFAGFSVYRKSLVPIPGTLDEAHDSWRGSPSERLVSFGWVWLLHQAEHRATRNWVQCEPASGRCAVECPFEQNQLS